MRARKLIGQPDQLGVEAERCAADPIYCMQWNPYHELQLVDYTDPAQPVVGTITMIDRILGGCLEIIERIHGKELTNDRVYADSKAFLLSPRAQHQDKLFYIYFVLKREPEACELIRSLFVPEHPGNLWGTDVYAHFDAFMLHIDESVEKTRNFPCSERNIQEVINQFVLVSKQEYLFR